MNNDFFKTLSSTMNALEENGSKHFYLLNPDIDVKAQRLYYDFVSSGINARIDYYPAYMQIVVTAKTYVLDIRKNNYSIINADVVCIDSTSDGLLHIECVFNNAFIEGGVINE